MSKHRTALEITMDILKYKDYEGTAELDMSRGVCRGKILFINDLVTYADSTRVGR
jgi:hypothetical protein